MATLKIDDHASYRTRQRAHRREYRLIFCLIYPQLLLVAIARRLVSLVRRRHPAPGEPQRSVFAEARIAACSCIPFAFK